MREFNREFKKIFETTQKLLGPAEQGWEIGPIKIEGQNYPETICNEQTREVVVRVTQSTISYPHQRTYQLLHESVHCLAPRRRRDTLFFEEGLANWYALSSSTLPIEYRENSKTILDPLLKEPYVLFCKLNPTYERVAALRLVCPAVDDATPEHLAKYFDATHELAESLVRRLPKDRPERMQ